MARYTLDEGINQPYDVVGMVMEDYIYHNRFSRGDWEGEPVYLCTDARGKTRYLKWNYASGILHLEAWLKSPLGEEMSLTGLGGGKSGKEYKESLDRLIQNLRSHSGTVQSAYIGQDPLHHPQQQGYVYGRPVNTPSVIVTGILAIVFAFAVPLLGIIFSTVGLNRCRTDGDMTDSIKKARNLCMAALIISIVVMVLSILVNFVFYDIMLL